MSDLTAEGVPERNEWNQMNDVDRQDIANIVREALLVRLMGIGKENYPGDIYHGDPLNHAFEELLDGLVAVVMARRYVDDAEQRARDAEAERDRLIKFD